MDDLGRRLLDEFQRGFPLTLRPYADVAARLGVDEDTVLDALRALKDMGALTRVGAVFRPGSVGVSTLAALAVPEEHLEQVAALVSAHPEVNHNYQRDHRFNVWFVATATDRESLKAVIEDIEAETGLDVLCLPMLESFCLDLGFGLQWS
ncbi:MAG: Lrp/AsnC family transcriptional regulator [Alphaproteobacteria bacterium]|nr:Lrp/AsnC family transcriptional regulator [Alphaproteobacteria bacterium]